MKEITICLIVLLFVRKLEGTHWDIESWQYLYWTNWKNDQFTLYTIGETRFNRDISKFYYVKISECLAYHYLPFLDLEAHYSYINHKSRGASQFTYSHRLELEATPSFSIKKGLVVVWRNRLDLIKSVEMAQIKSVFRDRLQLKFDLQYGPLIAMICSDEVFYDLNRSKFTQNRFIPLELQFEMTKKTFLEVFLMIRNFFTQDKWYRSIVLGAELDF